MNIGTLLPRHARYRPDHLCLAVGGERLSYRQFNARVNALANALHKRGVRKGDKIATVLPNCAELMTLYWVAAKTGIVIVPMSLLLQKSGLASLLDDSDSVMVFADTGFADMLDSIRGDLPAIAEDRYVLVGDGAGDRAGFLAHGDLIAGAGEDNPPDAGLVDDDVYNIMYTSGTTGAPKGIVHTHYVRAAYCTHFASAFRMTPESVVLHAGSIVFNGAMIVLMPWMFVGCTYVLHPSFDAGAVIREITAEKVTHIVMVPSQIIALLDHPDFDPASLGSLEMILSVGAPLLLEHKNRLNVALPNRFYELYGLTEGFMTVLDRNDSIRKAGSVGSVTPFFEMRIIDPDGNECPPGEVGEICGRGPMMMPGYYKRPDLTEEAIIDGWLHSGDAGYVDEESFLFLVDRIKDMIISGGVNVYPRDIEEIMAGHRAVAEVAVFGVPNDKWGEVPVAAVLVRDGETIEPAELMEWTNQRVDAKFQRITDAVILETFPRNTAAKTVKRDIRDSYLSK
jgi:acyl-CoA synthetase (AMP-forming)/AMP-acid ligase II